MNNEILNYVETAKHPKSNERAMSLSMFKTVEFETSSYMGVFELHSLTSLTRKNERCYFFIFESEECLTVALSSEWQQLMKPYHKKHLECIEQEHANRQHDVSTPVSSLIIAAIREIIFRRFDLPSMLPQPNEQVFPAFYEISKQVNKECNNLTFETFSKKRLKIESMNIMFDLKKDTGLEEIRNTLFSDKPFAAAA